MFTGILTLVQKPVLSLQIEISGRTEQHQSDGSGKIDRESKNVSRSIVTVQVGSPDVGSVTQRVDQGVDDGSLDGWSSDGTGDPGENHNRGRIEGRRENAHGKVSSGSVGRGESDDVAEDGDEEGADDVQVSLQCQSRDAMGGSWTHLSLLVRVPPVDHDRSTADQVWGSSDGQSDSSSESKTSNDDRD